LPRTKAPVASLTLQEMFGSLAEKISQQAREPNILGYIPHEKQKNFHVSKSKIKLYIGGNRSGKTMGGVAEDIWRLKGEHPFRKVPPAPVRGRAVCVDFNYGINQILIPKFKQLLPPSLLVNGSWEDSYNASEKFLKLQNGSTLEFMTYEQSTEKFAGVSRHFTHFDEEPPKHIYTECIARLIDTNGDAWITMTPVEGMTWVYDQLYEPAMRGNKTPVAVFEVDMLDNPYLSPEAAETFLAGLDDDERLAREKGKFVQLGGLVYKKFNREIHVIDPINPEKYKDWEWYESMDHGFRNPTAWLWSAVSRDGTIITFAEHYQSEWTVEQHAGLVNQNRKKFGKLPEFTVGDPATQQRQGVTGTSIAAEYAKHGIFIAPANNDVSTGVNQVTQYLRTNPETNKPYWLITENCPNLIREMELLRWARWATKKGQAENNHKDTIHKKNDHAADAARYFFTFMPDLTPEEPDLVKKLPRDTATTRFDQVIADLTLRNPAAGVENEWVTYSGSDIGALEYE
jgi:phage terminase large subunit-like protein